MTTVNPVGAAEGVLLELLKLPEYERVVAGISFRARPEKANPSLASKTHGDGFLPGFGTHEQANRTISLRRIVVKKAATRMPYRDRQSKLPGRRSKTCSRR